MDCGHWCGFLGRQVRADGGITLEMHPFEIGGYSDTPQVIRAVATIDEVSVWRRALDPREVRGLGGPSAARLTIEARSCDDPDCLDETFAAPAGSAPVYDLSALVPNRYFQFRALFACDDPQASPVLSAATVLPD